MCQFSDGTQRTFGNAARHGSIAALTVVTTLSGTSTARNSRIAGSSVRATRSSTTWMPR